VDARQLILEHTVVTSPHLCPEIELHLVTEGSALWRAGESELEALGIPEPYWAFCWAGGEALARHLLDHPQLVAGRRVLAFGAGSGVEAIAAARAGGRVWASDIDPIALEAICLNAELNRVQIQTTGRDLLGHRSKAWDVILAGDVCYQAEMAGRVTRWLAQLAADGALVLLGDPGRGMLDPSELLPLAVYHAPADNDRNGSSLQRTTVYRVTSRRPRGEVVGKLSAW
jgi:predicted nicotinamide N-methyase